MPSPPGRQGKADADMGPSTLAIDLPSRSMVKIPLSPRDPTSPVRFVSSANAFGLVAPSSSPLCTPARDQTGTAGTVIETSPSSGGMSRPRLRRPSMLSLAQTASFASSGSGDDESTASASRSGTRVEVHDPSSSRAVLDVNPFAVTGTLHPPPQWDATSFLHHASIRRAASAPRLPFHALTTSTPSVPASQSMEAEGSGSSGDMDTTDGELGHRSPPRWIPSHLQTGASRRKGKAKMDDDLITCLAPDQIHQPPFTGRPIPANLLATLISESSPLEHEMRSEARLQRLISSHPHALPLTPRPPRSARGRFPEMVGGDDDDDEDDILGRRPSCSRRSWVGRASSSDSDSDDMLMDDLQPEPVNEAFAAGMDMERPGSSSSSTGLGMMQDTFGKSTPGFGSNTSKDLSATGIMPYGQPTPPSQNGPSAGAGMRPRINLGLAGTGMVPSPGSGLVGAFGSLIAGGVGTPLGSPTIERLELAGSPSAMLSSPGLMAYRESTAGSASVRPSKRKAAQSEDRFDPYKRPRAGSPSLTVPTYQNLSPSRQTPSIPIPQSPSRTALIPFSSSSSGPSRHSRPSHSSHPYSRPYSSRSRGASPALSIGSTPGVLASSLGNLGSLGNNTPGQRPSINLGQAFVPVGPGAPGAGLLHGQGQLGGLGLLSLSSTVEEGMEGEEREGAGKGEGRGESMSREDSRESRDEMED